MHRPSPRRALTSAPSSPLPEQDRLGRVALLTGAGFLRLTGDFVRSFAGLDRKLEIFVDPEAFQRVQAHAARSTWVAPARHV